MFLENHAISLGVDIEDGEVTGITCTDGKINTAPSCNKLLWKIVLSDGTYKLSKNSYIRSRKSSSSSWYKRGGLNI